MWCIRLGVLSRGWRSVLLTRPVVDTTHSGTATYHPFRSRRGTRSNGLRAPTLRLLDPRTFVNLPAIGAGHYIDHGPPTTVRFSLNASLVRLSSLVTGDFSFCRVPFSIPFPFSFPFLPPRCLSALTSGCFLTKNNLLPVATLASLVAVKMCDAMFFDHRRRHIHM